MTSFTVLSKTLPSDTPEEAAARVVFVRDRFSWLAFLFTAIMLLRYGLWLAFLAYMAVSAILGALNSYAGLSQDVTFVVMVGFSLLIALELPAMRVRKLLARGYEEEGVVVAQDQDEAERRFFASWAPGASWTPGQAASRPPVPRPQTSPAAPHAAPAAHHGIIGSLPESAAR